MANEKIYPLIDVMIGGETTITREMTPEEKDAYDFFGGQQWTPEQIKGLANPLFAEIEAGAHRIARFNGERTH